MEVPPDCSFQIRIRVAPYDMPVRLTWHFFTQQYNIGFMVKTLRKIGSAEENSIAHLPLALQPSHEHTISGQKILNKENIGGSMALGMGASQREGMDTGVGVAGESQKTGGRDDVIVAVSFDNSHSVLRAKRLSYCISCVSLADDDESEELAVSVPADPLSICFCMY
eukprot:SAG31_NODE_10344_length_1152_cov_1.228870_1_plen_166_part_10